jgi:hypothetical protein
MSTLKLIKDILKESTGVMTSASIKAECTNFGPGQWALLVHGLRISGEIGNVIVAMYRTRDMARKHAKKINKALSSFVSDAKHARKHSST